MALYSKCNKCKTKIPYRTRYCSNCTADYNRTNTEKTEHQKFRDKNVWKKKTFDIKSRDNHMCQICIRNIYYTKKRIMLDNIQVHHIVPMKEDRSLWVEDSNLISLCKFHHDMAEDGEIPRRELLEIVKEQIEKRGF